MSEHYLTPGGQVISVRLNDRWALLNASAAASTNARRIPNKVARRIARRIRSKSACTGPQGGLAKTANGVLVGGQPTRRILTAKHRREEQKGRYQSAEWRQRGAADA